MLALSKTLCKKKKKIDIYRNYEFLLTVFYIEIVIHIYTYYKVFTHLYINEHLSCFCLLVIVNNFAKTIRSICLSKLVFSLCLDKYPGVTVLHRSCTNLHSHLRRMRLSFSPHPHQHLLSDGFFDDSDR